MDFTIEKQYKEAFIALLKSTCKKFKVEYTVDFSDEFVLRSEKIAHGDYIEESGYGDFVSFKQDFEIREVKGYIATVTLPDLAVERMKDTGYAYLGCIKNSEAVTVHPTSYAKEKGFSLSSLKEEIATFPCAECGRKVTRVIIHVFEGPEGDIAVYGSGCAVKKFGIDFTSVMDRFEKVYNDISAAWGEDGFSYGSNGSSNNYYYAPFFAFMCFFHIFKNGYMSGSKAWDLGAESTKEQTCQAIYLLNDSKGSAYEKKKLAVETKQFAEDCKLVWDEFVAWIPEFKETLNDDDFGFNMSAACDQMIDKTVSQRMAGFAAYLVFRYWEDRLSPKEPEIEWNEDYSNMNVGDKIKDFGPLVVEVVGLFAKETQWGTTRIYTLRDINTDIKYKWFSSSKVLDEDETQEIYSGSIKSFQDDPKFGKAVILTRCRVRQGGGNEWKIQGVTSVAGSYLTRETWEGLCKDHYKPRKINETKIGK